jgi:hypothetical protein
MDDKKEKFCEALEIVNKEAAGAMNGMPSSYWPKDMTSNDAGFLVSLTGILLCRLHINDKSEDG